jgi:hypothetical protein
MHKPPANFGEISFHSPVPTAENLASLSSLLSLSGARSACRRPASPFHPPKGNFHLLTSPSFPLHQHHQYRGCCRGERLSDLPASGLVTHLFCILTTISLFRFRNSRRYRRSFLREKRVCSFSHIPVSARHIGFCFPFGSHRSTGYFYVPVQDLHELRKNSRTRAHGYDTVIRYQLRTKTLRSTVWHAAAARPQGGRPR